MTSAYSTTTPVLIQGNALHIPLADQSVHTVICSPPYYGLRSYAGLGHSCWPGGSYRPVRGAEPIVIPGPSAEELGACAHVWEKASTSAQRIRNGAPGGLHEGRRTNKLAGNIVLHPSTGVTCQRCGCWKGTLGNEPTPSMFVFHLLLIFREIRRVVRDDGTFWCVIADSFSSGDRQGHGTRVGYRQQTNRGMNGTADPARPPQPDAYAQGCLLGIPAQVMLAAAADGWTVRNDLVWAKTAPMPESVSGWRWQQARCRCVSHKRGEEPYRNGTHPGKAQSDHNPADSKNFAPAQPDTACPTCHGTGRLEEVVLRKGSWRHTRSTETILMLTKGMQCWANGEAVKEAGSRHPATLARNRHADDSPPHSHRAVRANIYGRSTTTKGDYRGEHVTRNPRSVLRDPVTPASQLAALVQWLEQECPEVLEAYDAAQGNPRDVVTPKTTTHGLEHYASFPADLVMPLIKATCPERCCPQCGQGWAPVIEKAPPTMPLTDYEGTHLRTDAQAAGRRMLMNVRARRLEGRDHENPFPSPQVHGLSPTCPHYCTCPDDPQISPVSAQRGRCSDCHKLPLSSYRAGIVCDPFAGTSTTAEVARALGRRSIMVEASWHYMYDLARERLGFTDLAAWEGRHGPQEPVVVTDLPLFANHGRTS